MLDQTTIKAILEALLFVSDKPVTLRQMTAKIRHVVRKSRPDQLLADSPGEIEIADVLKGAPVVEPPSAESEEMTAAQDEASVVSPESLAPTEDGEADAEAARAQLAERQKELDDDVTFDQIKAQLFAIEEDLRRGDRGIELVQVAKGYQLRTKPDIASHLRDDKAAPPMRLSPSSLETLAIVAYEQPLPKHKIEDIRGVDCGGVLKTLLDRDFIRIVGRSEEPGRPLVYGTTAKFLEIFGLNSLKDLPDPAEFRELASASAEDLEPASEAVEVPTDGNEYIHVSDFEDADAAFLSESERAVLDELDQSLAGLKDVEKGIDLFQKKEEPEAQPALINPETAH